MINAAGLLPLHGVFTGVGLLLWGVSYLPLYLVLLEFNQERGLQS